MRLKCVNIVSADPKRLAEFYQAVLGLTIDESHGGPQRIEICCGGNREESANAKAVLIVVNRDEGYVPRAGNACQGFEFQVSDVDAEHRRISSLGVEAKEAPKDLSWGYRYFTIEDPDGNGIDLVQALPR